MSRPDGRGDGSDAPVPDRPMADPYRPTPDVRVQARYGRYVGLLFVFVVVVVTITLVVTKPIGIKGVEVGKPVPPFAVPLALGTLTGDANIATHAHEGAAGQVPACTVRGPQVLNICQLYEKGPVVLALFVDAGGCTQILSEMQSLEGSFGGVSFAAVALKGERGALRRLVRKRGLTFPIGIDGDGALAGLYRLATCPQVTFALPGGVVQSPALLSTPSPATLRRRVGELVAASRARGWKAPAT